MTVSLDYFSGIAQELLGKINRVSCLIKKSNLKSGEYHEEIVRHFLRGFMTGRYALKTGYIYLVGTFLYQFLVDEHLRAYG
jgi:hypothetical protein